MTLKSPLKTTFQQIRPTLTLFLYPLDCLRDHGTGPDLSPHDRQTEGYRHRVMPSLALKTSCSVRHTGGHARAFNALSASDFPSCNKFMSLKTFGPGCCNTRSTPPP